MRKFNLFAMAMVAVAVLFSACSTEEIAPEGAVSEEVKDGLTALGFDVSDLRYDVVKRFPGDTEGTPSYILEGDIVLTDGEMTDMLSTLNSTPIFEQYRTSNLVTGLPRTISITGLSGYGGGYDLNSTTRTALSWAVDNYNALNLRISFSLRYASNWTDMVVYHGGTGAGGSAGFPSGGNPYTFVNILSGTASYGTNVTEHVVGHEIGHCVGFRHTDYFNRSLSCGSGGNEGSAGVGAIHIPGTPTGTDTNSLMQACFSANEDGEFGPNDVTALNYLY